MWTLPVTCQTNSEHCLWSACTTTRLTALSRTPPQNPPHCTFKDSASQPTSLHCQGLRLTTHLTALSRTPPQNPSHCTVKDSASQPASLHCQGLRLTTHLTALSRSAPHCTVKDSTSLHCQGLRPQSASPEVRFPLSPWGFFHVQSGGYHVAIFPCAVWRLSRGDFSRSSLVVITW